MIARGLGVGPDHGRHELGWVEGAEKGAPDRGIVEGREELVHAQQADIARHLDDRSRELGRARQKRQEIEDRLLPPIRLALLHGGGGRRTVRDHVPYDLVELSDLGAGRPIGDALLARAVFLEAPIGDPRADEPLLGEEAERAAAHHLGHLLEGIGIRQPLGHDRQHIDAHLAERIGQEREGGPPGEAGWFGRRPRTIHRSRASRSGRRRRASPSGECLRRNRGRAPAYRHGRGGHRTASAARPAHPAL